MKNATRKNVPPRAAVKTKMKLTVTKTELNAKLVRTTTNDLKF